MEFFASFSSLHKDIYLDILTRLDAKSLSRFKLVSKHWNLFVSDPSFLRFYSKSRPCMTGFFYASSNDYKEKIRYVPFDDKEEYVSDPPSSLGFLDLPAILYNSCNGLLHWFSKWETQFISNPFTNKSIPLPWPFLFDEFFACGIAFDPLQSDHFKVVVLMLQSKVYLRSRIFSSETMQWSKTKKSLVLREQIEPYCRYRGVFLNGSVHWELANNMILVYGVEEQCGRVIQSPMANHFHKELGFSEPACLGVFSGRLHYCRVLGMALRVWAATQESSSDSIMWVQQHTVSLSAVMHQNPSFRHEGSEALAFLPDCQGVLLGVTGKIIAYHFNDCKVKEVCKVQRNGGDSVHPRMFFPYVHSLALFNLSMNRNKKKGLFFFFRRWSERLTKGKRS